ncbi:BNR-4 repeat-containing protein [Chitinophaga alhagiae]|uniref:BNR-4 repeat-containing protein n=1 Tax=Chitinophaga alhagiae TaxID=2203219 RepID=UPI000E5A1A13|nr:BNR-4 repeat-containing protein [Chitinophaga alhagiae]
MRFCISILCFLLLANGPAAFSQEVIAKDAAWCWFSDPRAIYHKGEKEAVYFGYINSRGDVMVKSLNLATNQEQEYNLHKELQVDDHNVPSFLFLPDGKLLTFYSHHNGDLFMRKSKNAEDITAWEDERILLNKTATDVYCYSNPIMLSGENNRIYLFGRDFYRGKGFEKSYAGTQIYYIYSDNYGETWSERKILLDNSMRNNPPYIKYTSDGKSRIDFLFTNGHPKIGNDVAVFHMYYKNGAFWQTNGRKIGGTEDLPVTISKVDKVYDPSITDVRAWIWDIAMDKKGRPVVAYARYPSPEQHQYYYARWNGKKWEDRKIADAGPYITIIKPGKKLLEAHYSGGIVLDHENINNIYLARKINGVYEIEKRVLNGKKEEIVPITSHSTADNVRPYVVAKKTTGSPILLWMNGHYYHYTDYQTDLKIKRQ